MISLHLARWLRDAGLDWSPTLGDEFMIPDHGMDDRVFRISDMVVEVRRIFAGTMIALNGTTEWALDSVMLGDALWLPREDQLREVLGPTFRSLEQRDGAFAVTFDDEVGRRTVGATTAVDAFATAVLGHLDPGEPAPTSRIGDHDDAGQRGPDGTTPSDGEGTTGA